MSTRRRDGDDPEETFDAIQREKTGKLTRLLVDRDGWIPPGGAARPFVSLTPMARESRAAMVRLLGPQIDERRLG